MSTSVVDVTVVMLHCDWFHTNEYQRGERSVTSVNSIVLLSSVIFVDEAAPLVHFHIPDLILAQKIMVGDSS